LTAAGFVGGSSSPVLGVALTMLWLLVGLNIIGLRVAKWQSNITTLIYAGGAW
jgi:hypothetical protein